MVNQATNADSGLKNHRVEFVREGTVGQTPTDPAWNLFSDNLESALIVSSDAQIEEQRGLGDVGVNDFYAGPEDHSASIEYHLQNWFTDGSGNPKDAAGDALLRASDNGLLNTHTVIDRVDHGGEREYTVAKGAHPNLGELSGDPGSGLPIAVSLEYEAKKVRRYRMAQPDSETIGVKSTSSKDTSQSVTIESDDNSTSVTLALSGTTEVTTTTSFSSIDAFELDAETEGDVVIVDSSSNELGRIRGKTYYGGAEGDLGVPALGAGSHASAIGSSYETFLDDTITRGGASLAAEIRSSSLSAENGYEKTGVAGTKMQAIHPGQQSVEFTATVAGNFEGHEAIEEHLSGQTLDIKWTFDGGSILLKSCALTDLGDVGPSAGDVVSTQENGFTASSVQIN